MEINNLIEAIKSRRSCRAYEENRVSDKDMEELLTEYNSLTIPFEHEVEMLPFASECSRKLYTSFTSAPSGIAFCANADILSQSKVGFLGELLILCATARGLKTCWIGHYNNEILANYLSHYDNIVVDKSLSFGFSDRMTGKMPLCVTPIGYEGKKNIGHKIMSAFGGRRKAVEDLLDENTDISALSEDVIEILNMALIAPSALNGQYWRFNVSQDNKTISVYLPKNAKSFKWSHPNLDIGISACHIWLALQAQGKCFNVKLQENDGCVIWEFVIE